MKYFQVSKWHKQIIILTIRVFYHRMIILCEKVVIVHSILFRYLKISCLINAG